MKKATLQIFTAILVLGLFCGTAAAIPSITSPSSNSTVTWTAGTTQTFKITTNESTAISWLVNGTAPASSQVTYDNGTNTSTLSHTVQLGKYDVKATAQSANDSRTWTVTGTSGLAADFGSNDTEGSIPLTVAFTDKSTNATSWQWNFGEESSNSKDKNHVHT